jgi:hypothetical protein
MFFCDDLHVDYDMLDDDCDIEGFALEHLHDCDMCVYWNRHMFGKTCDYFGTVCTRGN